MNKSIILVALCILCCAVLTLGAGSVSLKFTNDYLLSGHIAQILIETQDVNVGSSVTLTPAITPNDQAAGLSPTTWKFANIVSDLAYQYPFFGYTLDNATPSPYSLCTDLATGQINGILTLFGNSLSLTHSSGSFYSYKYYNDTQSTYGSFKFQCQVLPTNKPSH